MILTEASLPPLAPSFKRQPSGGQEGGSSARGTVEETRPIGAFKNESCLYLKRASTLYGRRIHPDRTLDSQSIARGEGIGIDRAVERPSGKAIPLNLSCPANPNASAWRICYPQNRARES